MSFYRLTQAKRPQPAAWIIYISILSDTPNVTFYDARGFPHVADIAPVHR